MIHQTYTARKAPKTPPGSHEMGPSTDAEHCLQPVHTIYMHPGGVGSAKCIFCPRWPSPLTFDHIRTLARFLYIASNCQVSLSYI